MRGLGTIPKTRIPTQTRRLQPGEHGYSATAKRRVAKRIGVGKVTAATRTFSDRQVATAKIARAAKTTNSKYETKVKGKRAFRPIHSKEAYTRSRVAKTREAKGGGTQSTYGNLSRRDLNKLLRANRDRRVVLIIHADRSGDRYRHKGAVWTHGVSQVDAETLLDSGSFDAYLRASSIISRPDRYGLEVLP